MKDQNWTCNIKPLQSSYLTATNNAKTDFNGSFKAKDYFSILPLKDMYYLYKTFIFRLCTPTIYISLNWDLLLIYGRKWKAFIKLEFWATSLIKQTTNLIWQDSTVAMYYVKHITYMTMHAAIKQQL